MSNQKTRLEKLEDKTTPPAQSRIYVYYHDKDKGYSASPEGEYFASLDELSAAQGWEVTNDDTLLSVVYADAPVKVFIPDNGRAG